ncbi:MAG: hypothetical protein QM770_02180 [Tepidisphaeraceae bacterium]
MWTRFAPAFAAIGLLSAAVVITGGCTERATLLPNADPDLNKPSTQLAREAVQKFPYPVTLAKSPDPLPVRAELGYVLNEISLLNYGDADLADIDLWVNGQYVVGLTKLESKKIKKVPFEVLYNPAGQHFPRDGAFINKLEMRVGEVMYDVTTQLGQ